MYYKLSLKDKKTGGRFQCVYALCAPSYFYEVRQDLFTMIVFRDYVVIDIANEGFSDRCEVVITDEDGNEIHEYTCWDGTVLSF